MKRISLLICSFIILTSSSFAANKILDIDFTRDSVQWKMVFPELQLTNGQKDYCTTVSNLSSGDLVFSGSFGRFNAGVGTMAQPEYIENSNKTRRFAFRIDNRESSMLELPSLQNVGRFTVFCKNENAYANSELAFFIQKKVGETWVNLRTVYVPPHHNQNFELQMEEFLNINTAVKLRIFGATRKLHIYQITAEDYDAAIPKEKPLKLILLPDPQSYLKQSALNPVYVSQPRWLNEIADSVKFVMNLGDITDDNSHAQWSIAAGALNLLEGKKIPFTFCAGNHDMGTGAKYADTRCTNLMNNYLPLNRYERHDYFGGVFEEGKIDNTWHIFSKGDYKFLLLSMEYAPRTKVLNWAKTLIEKYPRHNVIISTHSYLNANNELITGVSQLIGDHTGGNYANSGEKMWEKLVKLYPNCLLVFNGHIMGDGSGYKISTGDNGNKVYQFLSNYQAGVEGLTQNEKNGMLRIVDIYPEKRAFSIKAYSPYSNSNLEKPDQNFYYTDVDFIKDGVPESSIEEPSDVLSEDFSSKKWETELLLLNPGQNSGVPINPNALNPLPYTTPAPGGGNVYTNLNSTNLYFDKYCMVGSIETLEVMPCASGETTQHNNDSRAVTFRINDMSSGGKMEFPQVSNAGIITLHIRNGNEFMFTKLVLEKFENNAWENVHTFELMPFGALKTSVDEVLAFTINTPEPVKLRLRNDDSRFIKLLKVSVGSFGGISGLKPPKTGSLKLMGRTLVTEVPTTVSVYNLMGVLMFTKFIENEMELPQTVRDGIFIAHSTLGTQKLIVK